MKEEFVETLNAVQFSNGVVRMFFVGHELNALAEGDANAPPSTELRECVSMPLPGFLYAVSVIQNFMQDEKMSAVIEAYMKAGFLPSDDAVADQETEAA